MIVLHSSNAMRATVLLPQARSLVISARNVQTVVSWNNPAEQLLTSQRSHTVACPVANGLAWALLSALKLLWHVALIEANRTCVRGASELNAG